MPRDKLRIMYASNAPWCASGYGIQGRPLLPRLRQLPEVDDVALFAWFGLQGGLMVAGALIILLAGIVNYSRSEPLFVMPA